VSEYLQVSIQKQHKSQIHLFTIIPLRHLGVSAKNGLAQSNMNKLQAGHPKN